MKRKITVVGVNFVFTAIVTGYFAFEIFLFALSMLLGILYGHEYIKLTVMDNLYFSTLAQYILILLPVLVYIRVCKLNPKKVLRLNKPDAVHIFLALFIALPVYFISDSLNKFAIYFLQYIIDIPGIFVPIPKNIYELVIGILTMAVTPAICEEFLHRGLLLKAYENRGSSKAIVITALFFGLFHFDLTNLLGPVFSGIILGYLVVRTNSIYPAIVLHFINNTMAELFMYKSLDFDTNNIRINIMDLSFSFIYMVISLLILLFLLKIFNKYTEGNFKWKPSISSIKNDIISIITHWPVVIIIVLFIIASITFY